MQTKCALAVQQHQIKHLLIYGPGQNDKIWPVSVEVNEFRITICLFSSNALRISI